MKKPKRKKLNYGGKGGLIWACEQSKNKGYNEACDDWETFLPGEDELEKIIIKYLEKNVMIDGCSISFKISQLAQAISKRIRGEL